MVFQGASIQYKLGLVLEMLDAPGAPRLAEAEAAYLNVLTVLSDAVRLSGVVRERIVAVNARRSA